MFMNRMKSRKSINPLKQTTLKTSKILSAILLTALVVAFTSCSKDEGFEGKAMIKGVATYPGGNAAGAIVTISFGATEATTDADYSTVTDASGNYSFESLTKGDYFVGASYTDDMGYSFQSGGSHVEIGEKKGEVTVDLVLE
jgi:hypothetical protein